MPLMKTAHPENSHESLIINGKTANFSKKNNAGFKT